MARPIKQGLEYYPEDVDIYADDKIKFISAIFEAEGEAILHRMLAHIYRNGFYAAWGDDEIMLFAMGLPWRGKSINELNKTVVGVVDELLKRDFFCRSLFDKYKILTSAGIQKRYVTGTEKRSRIEIDDRYWLLKKEKPYLRDAMHFFNVNSPGNKVSSPENEEKGGRSTQSKVKESKVNTTTKSAAAAEQSLIQHFMNNINPTAGKMLIDKLCDWRDTFPTEVIMKAIDEAVEANKRSFSYIEGILRNWEDQKLFSLSLVEGHLRKWREARMQKTKQISPSGTGYVNLADTLKRG